MLFEQIVTKSGIEWLWNGEVAPRNQRPMWAYYEHCYKIADLKKAKDSLFEIRMRAIRKYFSKKDATHACIYKHYQEIEKW